MKHDMHLLKTLIKEEMKTIIEIEEKMESTWLKLGQGQCGEERLNKPARGQRPDKCPYQGEQTTVVKYYKGESHMKSRCRICDPRGWRRAADHMAAVGGGVHN